MARYIRTLCLLVVGALLLVLIGAATRSETGVNVNIISHPSGLLLGPTWL